MRTRIVCTGFLLAVYVTAATAQVTVSTSPDAASRADILRLFDVLQIRSQMNAVMTQMMLQTRAMTHEQMKKRNPNITPEELAKADAMSEQLIKEVPVDGMLEDMIPVYQKHLTKADVDAMIAFYTTPTGQKILREMPAMAAEGMQAMQPRLRKQMDETMQKVEEQTKGSTAKPTPATPTN